MKTLAALAIFTAVAPIASGQCIAFLVPPNVPIFTAEEGTNAYMAIRTDYVLVFPSPKMSFTQGLQVKIDEGAPYAFKPPKSAPCLPEDFKRSKDLSRIRAQMPQELAGSFFEIWIVEKQSIPITYDVPTGLKVSWKLSLQNAAENLAAIRHAADLKLDKIRNADFRPPEIENQNTFAADFDKTWSALVETLSDQKWQIESIDKGSGLITTKPAVDKGGNTMACATQFDRGNTAWLNIFAKKTDSGTRIKINATFHAMREGSAITCYSNGTIEGEIFKGIQENLK